MRNTLELEKDKYRGDNIKGVKYLFKPKKKKKKKFKKKKKKKKKTGIDDNTIKSIRTHSKLKNIKWSKKRQNN